MNDETYYLPVLSDTSTSMFSLPELLFLDIVVRHLLPAMLLNLRLPVSRDIIC